MRPVKWWILLWHPHHQGRGAYLVVQKITAASAPEALLKSRYRDNPLVIARVQGDLSVPVIGRDA